MSLATAGNLLTYLGKTCCLYALFDSCFDGRGLGGHLFFANTVIFQSDYCIVFRSDVCIVYQPYKAQPMFCSSDNRVRTGLKST